jgi:hypothetical protein
MNLQPERKTMNQSLERLYRVAGHELGPFGPNWCGPEIFPHGEDVTVAKYERINSDGQVVIVMCSAWPARFYHLQVIPEDGKDGYVLSRGSGQHEKAAMLALMIAGGMLTIKPLCSCKPLDSIERKLLDDNCPVHGNG